MRPRNAARLRDAATLLFAVCTLAAVGVATSDCDRRAQLSPFAPGAPSDATIALVLARGVRLRAVVFVSPSDAAGEQVGRYFRALAAATDLVDVERVDALSAPVRAASLDVRDNGSVALLRMDDGAAERDVLEVGHDGSSGRFAVARLDGDVHASLRRLLAPRPSLTISGEPSAELSDLLRRAGLLGDASTTALGPAAHTDSVTRDDLVLALSPPLRDDAALAARARHGGALLLAGAPGPLLDAALGERGVRFERVDAAAAQALVIGAHPAVAELHARLRVVPWSAAESSVLRLDRSAAAHASVRLATLLAVRDRAERVFPVAVALEALSPRIGGAGSPRRSLVLASAVAFDGAALRSEAGALLVVELLRWILGRDSANSEQRASAPPFAPRRHHLLGASFAAFIALPSAALVVAAARARRQRRR